MPELPTTNIEGTLGSFFVGQFPNTYCFVPTTTITNGVLDGAAYLKSGWASRNVRCNAGKTIGSHLFPELNQPVTDKKLVSKLARKVRVL